MVPPPSQKRNDQTETASIIIATTNDSANYQLTNSSLKEEIEPQKNKVILQWKVQLKKIIMKQQQQSTRALMKL